MADNFDEDGPYGGNKVNIGDDRIRQNNRTLKASLEVEHDPFDANNEADGRHKFVTLQEQALDVANVADEGKVYSKEVATITELFYRDSAGTVTQITSDGLLALMRSAAASDAQRTMLADLILAAAADLIVESGASILLANANVIKGRDIADAAYLDLLALNGSDETIVGNVTSTKIELVASALSGLIARHAGGTARILTVDDEGSANGLDADTVDAIEGAEILNDDTGNYYSVEYSPLSAEVFDADNHGLGGYPRLVTAYIECIDAGGDDAYILGDRIALGEHGDHGDNRGVTVWYNATQVGYGRTLTFMAMQKDGYLGTVDMTKWKLGIQAWK